MEHLLQLEEMLSVKLKEMLPIDSAAALFLIGVNDAMADGYRPGKTMIVRYPSVARLLKIDPPQRIVGLNDNAEVLHSARGWIELQVPPLTGGSPSLAGISLARLLWRIPVQSLMTLVASLLLERRTIMVCTSKDTLSAAVHAAAALIYPFEWPHRFYLPLMPHSMRDHLQAPFPFLVGLPAALMDFRGLEMDEVTLIDLDLGTCIPESGSESDDANRLPHRASLEKALHEAVKALRSPTEFEGNVRISDAVTEYVVRIFKNYRRFVFPREETIQMRQRGCLIPGRIKSRNGRSPEPRGLDLMMSRELEEARDGVIIEGHGYYFDHTKFVASHKSKSVRSFLDLFRHSQMYEIFICQRLEMAALGVYPKDDPFEYKINLIDCHSKLTPGHLPYRNWSRRVLSNKFNSLNESRIKKSKTITQEGESKGVQLETLLEDKLESQRRISLGESPIEKRGSQTIRTVVAEMAKQSSLRLSRSKPNSFLQRSRASFVERPDVASQEVVDVADTESPLDPRPESSSPSDDLPIIDSHELGSISSLQYVTHHDVPDAIDFSMDVSDVDIDRGSFHHAMDDLYVPTGVTPEMSHREMKYQIGINEKIPRDVKYDTHETSWGEKIPRDGTDEISRDEEVTADKAAAFVESNLRQLKNGGMDKKAEAGKKPDAKFGRSTAFTFKSNNGI